jgi:hypothetical protein
MSSFEKELFVVSLLPRWTNVMQVRDSLIAPNGEPALAAGALNRAAIALSLVLILVVLWLLTHRYAGLRADAELYAFQAFARIHPSLANDIYLRYGSQAQYTIFSPLYAQCIRLFGLSNAALALTIVFKLWFFAAAWMFACALWTRKVAVVSTALLIVAVTDYGSNGVFQYAEDWVTARSFAEALVITALALFFRGLRVTGLLVALGSLLIHPLMALPGFLLLLCLRISFRASAVGVITGVLGSLGLALAATAEPSSAHLPAVIDSDWLQIVRERSQFLFLQLWSARDWMLNVRPFLSLAISATVLRDPRITKICAAAVLVGVSGMAVALIGCLLPVAIYLQGQGWRWIWVTAFIGVILAAPTVLLAWRDKRCGPLCALLIFSAWMLPATAGAVCMAFALLLWSLRHHISPRQAFGLRCAAVTFGIGIVGWTVRDLWLCSSSTYAKPPNESFPFALLRHIAGLKILALLLVSLIAHWIQTTRLKTVVAISAALTIATASLLPKTFEMSGSGLAASGVDDFSDWRRAIPENANVLVLPSGNSPRFAWFTLERPSYLSVNQSSGVVFSRLTALEVRRRGEVMLPVADPDWQILSKLNEMRGDPGKQTESYRALTAASLVSLCADPQLNFVVAKENVGFDPIRHVHNGSWKDWNLYDCRHIPALIPAA